MNKYLIKEVAKVIGKKLAIHELSIVESADFTNPDGRYVNTAFSWCDSPQGVDFWVSINRGEWPYNYTRGKS